MTQNTKEENVVEGVWEGKEEAFGESSSKRRVPLERKNHGEDYKPDSSVKARYVDIDMLQKNFDDMVEQSAEHSNKISESISIDELGAKSSEILIEGTSKLMQLSSKKTFSEKMLSLVPSTVVRKKLEQGFKVAEKERRRNQSVSDFATAHFDHLNNLRNQVNQNRASVDEISRKLHQSNEMLLDMKEQADEGLQYILENGESKDKEIKAKSLVISITNQIISQEDIREQAELFEQYSSVVSDDITSALPVIKDQFLNQVSVSGSLKNLVHFKDAFEQTEDMLSILKKNSLEETLSHIETYQAHGLRHNPERDKRKKENEIILSKIRDRASKFEDHKDKSTSKDLKEIQNNFEKNERLQKLLEERELKNKNKES